MGINNSTERPDPVWSRRLEPAEASQLLRAVSRTHTETFGSTTPFSDRGQAVLSAMEDEILARALQVAEIDPEQDDTGYKRTMSFRDISTAAGGIVCKQYGSAQFPSEVNVTPGYREEDGQLTDLAILNVRQLVENALRARYPGGLE